MGLLSRAPGAPADDNEAKLSAVQASLQPHIVFGMNLTRNLSLLRTAERLRLVQDEHIAIVTAIEARDGLRPRAAMAAHIENARHRMFEGAPAKRH